MNNIRWRTVELPDFGVPEAQPEIPVTVYEERCRRAYAAADCTWLVVYGDREHYANLTYLTEFDPRFEEALLLLGPDNRKVLVVGNEGVGYAALAKPQVEVVLCQTFGLMGQDRSRAPRLYDVLREAGIRRGDRVGLAGWKYLEPEEATGELPSFFAPAILVDYMRLLTGDPTLVIDATRVLMHPTQGLRVNNEVEQIAAFEWAAARATRAVLRVLCGLKPGMTELAGAGLMGLAGEPLSAHVMLSAGKGAIIGLRSPRERKIEYGDGVTTAVGFWGGLCARAGLMVEQDQAFLERIAIPYYRAIATWYRTARLGVTGSEIATTISQVLEPAGLQSLLNPGHLTSLDEWVHSPVRPGSDERIASGMAFQCDIIPVPMPPGCAVNCEDPVVFADERLRAELQRRYPDVWSRISARQTFMREELGLEFGDELLPLSTMPAYLPPCWLAPERVLSLA